MNVVASRCHICTGFLALGKHNRVESSSTSQHAFPESETPTTQLAFLESRGRAGHAAHKTLPLNSLMTETTNALRNERS